MNDLALGIVVLTFAAVPASLLLLAVADVIHLPDAERRNRWINRCLAALALPGLAVLGVLVWGWAGAAHLGPLCAAYATPEYRHDRPLELRSLLVDSDQGANPPWAGALPRSAGGPVESLEFAPTGAAGHVLEARRRTHHENRWFKVEMDRFRLRDRATDSVVAEGDELWIRAGRATYHCGIGSGPEPTADSAWPGGPGVARFLEALRRAPPAPPG